VVAERCIGCGNCVRVCSQKAKRAREEIDLVFQLFNDGAPVAIIVAPSFAADFAEYHPGQLVGMLRRCNFALVCEVGFGADLVAAEYKALITNNEGRGRYIATTCPAVVTYVELYHPDLVKNLAPIVSPMIATARALRAIYGQQLKIVFAGPCIAKKNEARDVSSTPEVDAVLTFQELRSLIAHLGVAADSVVPSRFDPPWAGYGSLFPLSRGLLQSAQITEDLLSEQVATATGAHGFIEALREFESEAMDVELLELLSCDGCIMGPGMVTKAPRFTRRNLVSRYVRNHACRDPHCGLSEVQWASLKGLDLFRSYHADDRRGPSMREGKIREILFRMGKFRAEDELNCGSCGYDTCREHAQAIQTGLAESEMCLPYTIDQLKKAISQLADTQEALMHSERLASMGQLAAGVAHEVNNPLGVVLMYAHLLLDEHGQDPRFAADLNMIVEQADRCKKIVAGLLDFARQNQVILEPVLARELLEHSLNAAPAPATIDVSIQEQSPGIIVNVDRDQMTQVLINLITNAYQAMPDGGKLTLSVSTTSDRVIIVVTDTGTGIAKENMSRIFHPFFTTKAPGKGTGLGLAVTYGIIKTHRGDIKVQSNADPAAGPTGTAFTVSLPKTASRR
jgi:iron only hydrogenase large subunit-like protein/nitrogen-specific signal transduction histidine kinase